MADDRCAMRDELQFLGLNASEPIVDKCLEICSEFDCTAEALLEEWIGYAAGHLKGKLDPTLDGLDAFARRQTEALKGLGGKKTIEPVQESDNIVYDQPPEVKSILEAYTSGKPKTDSPNKRIITHNVNQPSSFVPATYSPKAGKSSESYRKRTDSGQVITTYDPKSHLNDTEKRITLNKNIDIQLLDLGNNNSLSEEKYMFDVMETEVSAAVNRIDRISQLLIKKNDMIETNKDSHLTIMEQGKIEYGRIRSEGDGRLNISSVLLEQRDGCLSRINLINQKSYSFFPGQIIAMKTSTLIGPNRSQFLPNEMHTDVTPELSKLKPDIKGAPLNVIVASGPFTLFDNLTYEPLQDLITYVKKDKPDVLILIGPFVDSRHVLIADGSLAESFNTHFENILNCALLPLKDYDVEIILIPSTLDAHHHPIYPTPPYIFENKLLNNIHQMPDPALFTINDIVIGATSVDVLFHLAKTEFSFQAKNKDRMARFISHLLSQQTFYPLNPAVEKLCVDHGLLEKHGNIPVLPHLMIVPSNFGQFIKVVDSCIVINPERLCKGYVGGTFARIQIYPNEAGPLENITCQIIKI